MAMAKTYSVRYYDMLLEQIRTMKASAASYIDDIKEKKHCGLIRNGLRQMSACPLGLVLSHQILLSR